MVTGGTPATNTGGSANGTGGTSNTKATGGKTSSSSSSTSATQTGGTSSSSSGGAATVGGTSASVSTTAVAACTGSGSGLCVGSSCLPVCQNGALTDPDSTGATDGYGWELQANCVVSGSTVAAGKSACDVPARDLPTPGDGRIETLNSDGTFGACIPLCASGALTDPGTDGTSDGWGWELLAACIVPDTAAAAQGIPCVPPTRTDLPPAGNGRIETLNSDGSFGACLPLCQYGELTDTDGSGWGFEYQTNCIVPDTKAAAQGIPCVPPVRTDLPPGGDGREVKNSDGTMSACYPPCTSGATHDSTNADWGSINSVTCIWPNTVTAAQGIPCAAAPVCAAFTPPSSWGTGWLTDPYTATMFGHDDCAPLGFSDSTNINQSVCPGTGKVTLDNDSKKWFGAPGDLSTIWKGNTCTCPNGQTTCIPSCSDEQDCGKCFEIAANPSGTVSLPGTGDTHCGLLVTTHSVVIKVIDACPHNHSNNTFWCTTQQKNHIDISCDAFRVLTNSSTQVGDIGSINVWVRPLSSCPTTLGDKTH